MGANIAGIYGAQIFRQEDRPFYRQGFTIACAVLAVGLLLAIVRFADDFVRRRRSRNQLPPVESASDDGETKGGEGSGAEPQPIQFVGDSKEGR